VENDTYCHRFFSALNYRYFNTLQENKATFTDIIPDKSLESATQVS
jgi:hypothetical protein